MAKEFINDSYQDNKVAIKGIDCPAIGVYRPLRIYSRNYCGERKLIMKAYWKPSYKDNYGFDNIVQVDLEPFFESATGGDYVMLNERSLLDKEIVVHSVCSRSRKGGLEFEIKTTRLYKMHIEKMYAMGNMALDALIMKQIENRNEK